MQDQSKIHEEKISNEDNQAKLIEELRKDYTNLQALYWTKLVTLTVFAFVTIFKSVNNIRELVVGAFIFSATILFDIIVVILSNKGPKTKHSKWCIALLVIVIIVLAGAAVLLLSDYVPQGIYESIIAWFLRLLLIFIGVCGPYTELTFNKPNDD